MPSALRQLHNFPGRYVGRCSVEGGRGWLKKLALRLGRFPPNADDIPVKVKIDRAGQAWVWERDFGGHTTRSLLAFDHGSGCVREQMGQLTLWLKPEVSDGRLSIHIRRLSVLGLRCPAFLLPRSSTVEWQDENGRFRFDVSAEMPLFGPLIRYRGWLAPVHAGSRTG
ncbi:DUF4166 domain-containing protein [Ruegeria lacuscaerulensis]|uniref:DUF4166 domain-containing protein n=1 Tax=Ruegeria lacuscaerulensis TaxID=55218 RepID=UPI001F2D3FFA|nr:DUF4166 domain-containing protein [Ruegeria lacuscaerulensis]